MPIIYNGPIVSLATFAYFTTTIIAGKYLHLFNKRKVICLSFFVCSLSLFVMGPSHLLRFPDVFFLFMLGFFISNAAQGVLVIPILPEIVDSFCLNHGLTELKDEKAMAIISDRASALYVTFFNIGMIVSPIIGSIIYEINKSFNSTCDVFALSSLVYTVLYFVVNIIPYYGNLKAKES